MEYELIFREVMSSPSFRAFKDYFTNAFRDSDLSVDVSNGRVLVVGAGICGLSTAVRLRLAGFEVSIVAKEFTPKDTKLPGYVSTVAGAVWEYPPAVCCYSDMQEAVRTRNKVWAEETFHFFKGLSQLAGDHGVKMIPVIFYFWSKIEDHPVEKRKVKDYAKLCPEFKRGLDLVDPKVISKSERQKIVDAFEVVLPVIDSNKYTLWLHLLSLELGISFHKNTVPGPLSRFEDEIKMKYKADIIVNCSGLSSIYLAPDADVLPLRGAYFRVWNDGRDFPIVQTVHAIGLEEGTDEQGNRSEDMIFIVPRGDVLVLGGIAQEWEWDTQLNVKAYTHILERCQEFMPALRKATLIEDEPLRIGLRPSHRIGAKNCVEAGTSIVHNYGHGGSGFTYSIGSAGDILKHCQQIMHKADMYGRVHGKIAGDRTAKL